MTVVASRWGVVSGFGFFVLISLVMIGIALVMRRGATEERPSSVSAGNGGAR